VARGSAGWARELESCAVGGSRVDIDLMYAILTCVTAGPGLGFNRAALFLASEDARQLEAAMAIGPGSSDEARATWAQLASRPRTLEELAKAPGKEATKSVFEQQLEGLTIPLSGERGDVPGPRNPLLEAFFERRVVRAAGEAELGTLLPSLRSVFAGSEVVCVPLLGKDRALGLIVADNAFTGERIDDQRVQLLQLLAFLAGLAMDNARMVTEVERQAGELRRALAELESTHERLLQSERLATVGAVVARVSHEIRNPLATIGGFARTLSQPRGNPEQIERKAAIIADEVDKLEQLLKEMLDFTNPHPPRLEASDANALISAFADLHRGALEQQGIELRVALTPGIPAVRLDRGQIERALLNLLQNARQAIEEAGRAPGGGWIALRSERVPGGVRIVVQDNGMGIQGSARPHIWNPFFTTRQRGTGLGLSVVKKIVDDHLGSIHVESTAGEGTAFSIALPESG
jgi:signal transduction histidine kinase